MKHFIITVVIAVATGISGFFIGANKDHRGNSTVSLSQQSKEMKFSSETIFQINQYGTMSDAIGVTPVMTRQFFQTQFAIIESQETIRRAIDDYGLKERLDKNEQELIKEIASSVSLGQERGTDLVKLEVHADSELEAQQIAYALLHTYSRRRIEALDKRRKETIETFKDKRKIQEDKVEDYRTRLYALSKKLWMPYHGKNANNQTVDNSADRANVRQKAIYENERRITRQAKSFMKILNDEDLMVALLVSGRPESAIIKADYDQVSELKRNRELALARGLGQDHKKVLSLNDSIEKTEQKLARSVVKIRKKLAEDLVVFKKNAEKLRADTDKEPRVEPLSDEEKMKFSKVRDDYERELAILDAIKQAEFIGSIGESLEREPIVIHQHGWTSEVAKEMPLTE